MKTPPSPSPLHALLERWRAEGSPLLAAEIDRVSQAERRDGRERLAGSTVAARQLDWDKLLKRYDPSDLPRLVDALLSFGRRSAEYRLPLLHARGRDPRLARALTGWVEERPAGFQGQPTDGFWKAVLQILGEIGDVRQLVRLEAVHAQVSTAIGCHADTLFRVGLPPLLQRLRELPPEELPPKVNLSALFAAVYADPDADEARAVLADQLLEAGDARGELISLQLKPGKQTREAARRCRELIAAHGQTWAGALAPAVRKEGLEYRRGFLHACRLGATPAAIDLANCAELATVEELTVAQGGELPAEAWRQARSLRVLGGHCSSVFASPVPLPRLTELDVEGSFDSGRVAGCSVFPALIKLRIESMLHGPDGFELWRSPMAAQLTSVWVGQVFGELAEWREWMEAAPPQVEKMSVGVVRTQIRLTVRRVSAGFRAEVRISTNGEILDQAQGAVDTAVDEAATELALAGLERCAAIELSFRPNARGPGFPGTDLPPSEGAVARLKSRWAHAEIKATATPW